LTFVNRNLDWKEKRMGKASEAVQELNRPLSADQVRARQQARSISDPSLEATLKGTLEKPAPTKAAPAEKAFQADVATWD
jgi:hypothetical protein